MSAVDPRLSINQATIKYADLATALKVTADAGVQSIGLWREPVNDVGLDVACRMLNDSGLRFSTHCRGGFFTLPDGPERTAALEDNRRAIDETAALAAAGAAGSTAVSIKLTRAGAIEGTLTGFDGSTAVFFWSADRGPGQNGRALVQGATFSRTGMAPGRYVIEAIAGAHTDAASVEVRAGETAHVELHSRAVASIEGTVADLATRRLDDVRMFFYFYLFYNLIFAMPASNFLIANPLWPAFFGMLSWIRRSDRLPAPSPGRL